MNEQMIQRFFSHSIFGKCTVSKLVFIITDTMYYKILALHLTHPTLGADMQQPCTVEHNEDCEGGDR